MTALPAGWREVRLGDVAQTDLGKMLDRGKVRGGKQVPYLRNQNVQWGRFDLDSVSKMELLDDELERFAVREGDLLVCEGGEIGRCAIWPGSTDYMGYQKALHRVRIGPDLDARFARYWLEDMAHRGELARRATGSTIKHLPQVALRDLPLALPPLEEQHRIVSVVEDHLSGLDAAAAYLSAADARSASLATVQTVGGLLGAAVDSSAARRAVAADAGHLPDLPHDWWWSRLGDIADVVGGVTKDAGKQHAAELIEAPYLRVANVQRGHLNLAEVKSIRVAARKASTLRLVSGDVLMNEGGDRDKLGRGWVWSGEIDGCIHQNHVFRARVRDDVLRPRLLSYWANTVGGQWCERHGRQSVNLASISLSRIRQMPVPVPPMASQKAIEERIDEVQAAATRLRSATSTSAARGARLREGLLTAAFTGAL